VLLLSIRVVIGAVIVVGCFRSRWLLKLRIRHQQVVRFIGASLCPRAAAGTAPTVRAQICRFLLVSAAYNRHSRQENAVVFPEIGVD